MNNTRIALVTEANRGLWMETSCQPAAGGVTAMAGHKKGSIAAAAYLCEDGHGLKTTKMLHHRPAKPLVSAAIGPIAIACSLLLAGCLLDDELAPVSDSAGTSELHLGDHGPMVRKTYEYLRQHGYYHHPSLAEDYPGWMPAVSQQPLDGEVFDEALERGVRLFQRAHGLSEDGIVSREMLRMMEQPRCAFPDYYDNPVKGVTRHEFNDSGSHWSTTNLTYYFQNYTPDLSQSEAREAIESAFQSWGHVSLLSFTEQSSSGHIRLRWSSYDGSDGTLAYAYYPSNGDVTFDEDETWKTNGSSYDLETVALHEFGHSIGLGHSSDSGAVMYAYYGGSKRSLQSDDILGAQSIYDTNAKSFQSYNYPSNYIRHQDDTGKISEINSQLDTVDAQFYLVSGLADSSCVSFQSVNFSDRYLRHKNYQIKLHTNDNSSLFAQDATFCQQPGNADSQSYSFESHNYPGYYIRHAGGKLYIATGTSSLFYQDSTFNIVDALQ